MTRRRFGTLLASLTAAALFAACIPIFVGGLFQTLRLSLVVDDTLGDGEERLVQTITFAEDVKVRKTFVQISGRLTPAEDLDPPTQVTISGEIVDPDNGKVVQRITVRLPVDNGGNFEGSARVRKNVSAGETMSVTVEPSGGEIRGGSELTICVDLVKKKGELALLPDCVEPDEPPAPEDPAATFSSLSNDFFAPTCASVGCHSSGSAQAGLVLSPAQAYANLVNVPSSQRPQLNRVTPGDPDNSYLVKKLRGDADIDGQRMPRGGPFLSADQIDRFVRWIQNGAPDN